MTPKKETGGSATDAPNQELFSLIESMTGNTLLQSQMNDIIHVVNKDLELENAKLRECLAVAKPLTDYIVDLVNGWQRDPKDERHSKNLGVTLKTKAGVCYDIFDALEKMKQVAVAEKKVAYYELSPCAQMSVHVESWWKKALEKMKQVAG